jgi:hypothetical protein
MPVIVRFAAHADIGRFQGHAKHLQRAGIVAALKAQSGASLRAVEPILGDPSVSRWADLWAINGLALSAGAGVIEALGRRPEVARISMDRVIEGPRPVKAGPAAAEWNLNAIRAPELWAPDSPGRCGDRRRWTPASTPATLIWPAATAARQQLARPLR